MVDFLLNKRLGKCTIKITSKNIERCRKLWMTDHTRYGRKIFSYPSDSLDMFKRYGVEEYFYIEKEKYYKSELDSINKAISELESDLKLVQSSYLSEKGWEELENLKWGKAGYEKRLLEVQNQRRELLGRKML